MNTVIRARIDERVKEEAAAVLEAIGLTVSDAFRLLMVRTATEKRLPFEPLVPSEETVAAMLAARRADAGAVGRPGELTAEPNAADAECQDPLRAALSDLDEAVTGRRGGGISEADRRSDSECKTTLDADVRNCSTALRGLSNCGWRNRPGSAP